MENTALGILQNLSVSSLIAEGMYSEFYYLFFSSNKGLDVKMGEKKNCKSFMNRG